MKDKTLVLGASENPERYSNKAILRLRAKGHKIVGIGRKAGKIDCVGIVDNMIADEEIDTVTMYLNPVNQKPYYGYVLSLKPRRIIFNPGSENEELEQLARQQGIKVVEACTLVLLATGQY